MERDDERLDHFLSLMPDWIPVAMELRHPSWDDPAVFACSNDTTPHTW